MHVPRISNDDDDDFTDLTALRDALTRPLPAGCDLLSVSVAAPHDALEKFLRLVPRKMGFMWRSKACSVAGGGVVAAITASGSDRMRTLREGVNALWSHVHSIGADDQTPALPPVLFGGFAFLPDVPPVEPWEEFTEDAFSLARWVYRRADGRSFLTLTVRDEERGDAALIDAFVAKARDILRALASDAATSLIQQPNLSGSSVHHLAPEKWGAYMTQVLDTIRSGTLDKIVAARRCIVDLEQPIEDTGFMARLAAAYPDCTHFAIRRDESTFLGATPETLFRKDGYVLRTHALAGTRRIKDDPGAETTNDAAALRNSSKDLCEHALVVKRIHDELWPLATRIRYAASPRARHVRNLVHLETPITADLKPDSHVFDLLAALHPTPAVGGFPAREAARWIGENEPLERGWYTGGLGWMDAAGNAEFAVAIRSGVLTKKRVHIFAGAGIVAGSDPESEYKETGAKMAPILRALGLTY